MPAPRKHRDPIVDTAIRQFRKNGYPATALNTIVELSGAPKGSVYHYFPNGKPSIAAAAVEEASRRMARTMRDIASKTSNAEEFIKEFASTLSRWLRRSGYRDGCPMTTVLLELSTLDRSVAKAGRHAYAVRFEVIREVLQNDGISASDAEDFTSFCMSSLNGAIIEARVFRNSRPILSAGNMLAHCIASLRQD